MPSFVKHQFFEFMTDRTEVFLQDSFECLQFDDEILKDEFAALALL